MVLKKTKQTENNMAHKQKKKTAVVQFVADGGTYREAQAKFKVALTTVAKWVQAAKASDPTAETTTSRTNALNGQVAFLRNQNSGLRSVIADLTIENYRYRSGIAGLGAVTTR
jgi:transposase